MIVRLWAGSAEDLGAIEALLMDWWFTDDVFMSLIL